MHFEFLVEGQGELTTLSTFMHKILGEYEDPHTWRIHKHRGIGKMPDDPTASPNRHDQTLLHNLPSKLRAYGREERDDLIVIVLVDLDEKEDCKAFKSDLTAFLDHCSQKPNVLIRIAIEELESWFLGDREALAKAYPQGDFSLFQGYVQDSQCGAWELLADMIYPGGRKALFQLGEGKRSPRVLEVKRKWAAKIAPQMDMANNLSPSFCVFRDGLQAKIN